MSNGKAPAENMYFLLEVLSLQAGVMLSSTDKGWCCHLVNSRKGINLHKHADMAYKAVTAAHEAIQRGEKTDDTSEVEG